MFSCRRGAARLCALFAALFVGPVIAAQRLDFNQPMFQGDGVTKGPGDSPLLLDGYSFTAVGRPILDSFAIDDLPGKVGNGTPRLFALNDSLVLLASAAGNPIDLLSVDFGGYEIDPLKRTFWADKIEILGYRGDAVVGTTILDLDPRVPEANLMTFSFGSQFRGLSRVSFHGLGDIGPDGEFRNNHAFSLDNLVVSQVPEPEHYAMLLAGLGLLVWRRRSAAARDAKANRAD